MLFNSYEFIFAFLPLTILLVWLFGRYASFQAVVCTVARLNPRVVEGTLDRLF